MSPFEITALSMLCLLWSETKLWRRFVFKTHFRGKVNAWNGGTGGPLRRCLWSSSDTFVSASCPGSSQLAPHTLSITLPLLQPSVMYLPFFPPCQLLCFSVALRSLQGCRVFVFSRALSITFLLKADWRALNAKAPENRFRSHKHTGCPTSPAVNPLLSEILFLVNSSTYRMPQNSALP